MLIFCVNSFMHVIAYTGWLVSRHVYVVSIVQLRLKSLLWVLLRNVLACISVGCRWNFVQGESGLQANRLSARQAASSKLYRRKLQKRLMHHKQQLLDLQQAKKHFFTAQVWRYFMYLYSYCNLSILRCDGISSAWMIASSCVLSGVMVFGVPKQLLQPERIPMWWYQLCLYANNYCTCAYTNVCVRMILVSYCSFTKL